MAVIKAPVRQQSYLTEYDRQMAEYLRRMGGSIGAQDIAAEAYGGKFPVGTMTAKILSGVLAGASDRRAKNREERRNEAMSKLLQGYDKLPEAPVGSEEFVGGTYMREGGDIVTNLAPVEDRSYGKDLEASQQLGTVLRGSDGAQPNFVQRNFGGALPEKRIFNENQMATEAGFDAMDYNLYKQQVEAARPKPQVGEVDIFYDNQGKEFEGQTVVFPDGTVKVKRPDEPIQTANYYNWDDITRTAPAKKKMKIITDSVTKEVIAIDENNVEGGYLTIREGINPPNIQKYGNIVVDTNQLNTDGTFKTVLTIPKDVEVDIQTYETEGGITKTVAKNKLTGEILWQDEIEKETIRIGERGEILSMVGSKVTQLRPPEEKDKQTIKTPEGTFIWNAKEGTLGEKLFDADSKFNYQEVFDPELNKNMLYVINQNNEVVQKFDAKKDVLKKSAREIKISSYMEEYNLTKPEAIKLADKQISIKVENGLVYKVDNVSGKATLISGDENINAEEPLINKENEGKKEWLVPRNDISYLYGPKLEQMSILETTSRKALEDVSRLHSIIKENPSYIGKIGALNRQAQGMSGVPVVGETFKSIYGGATGIDLDDPNLQEVNRLIRSIETAITAVATAKGFRDPSQSRIEDVSTKLNLEGLLSTGKSALPALEAEFYNLNNQFMDFQSMNPNNSMIEDFTKNPKFFNITGNNNRPKNQNVIIRKTYNPETEKFEVIRQ